MKRRTFVQVMGSGLADAGLAKAGTKDRADQREIHAFRPCAVGRIELVGADGQVKATRRLAFPVRMEYGDKVVVTLKD